MKPASCEVRRVEIPFKTRFQHAEASRSHSDTLFVILRDEEGHEGLGEILARSYVSGETHDDIMARAASEQWSAWRRRSFSSAMSIREFLASELDRMEKEPALFGGFEIALRNLARSHFADDSAWIGPERTDVAGRCETIGFEVATDDLRRRVLRAQLAKATTVKIKVRGAEEDAVRVCRVSELFKHRMPIRLDANGSLDLESAKQLLKGCETVPLHSLEQPFDASLDELPTLLQKLKAACGVPLMADESLCSRRDLEHWVATGGYDVFNVRVGKCGGLTGAVAMLDLAREAGVEVVGGAMVGESGVLNQESERLLAHRGELPYVEGLGQNVFLLQTDPVEFVAARHGSVPRFRPEVPPEWTVDSLRLD